MGMEIQMTGMDLLRSKWGDLSKVARALDLGPAAVSAWPRVPAERLLDVERITGHPRELLRPDLYDFSGRKVTAVEVAEK